MDARWGVVIFIIVILLADTIRNRQALQKITTALEKRVEGQSHSHLPVYIETTEYRQLVTSLNQLLSSVEQQMEKLNRSQQEMGETLVSLSHDLRTPLTSAKGYVELLLAQEFPKEQEEILKIVHRRLVVLNDLLEQLFTYMKVHDERYELSPEEICLSDLLVEMMAEHYPELEARGLELKMDVEERIIAYQDPKALRQILFNVIQNVLRYGENFLSVSLKRKKDAICLIFCNPTQQMAEQPEMLKKSYVTGAGNRPEGSSGLGLSIIAFFVEKMGGTFEITFKEHQFVMTICLFN